MMAGGRKPFPARLRGGCAWICATRWRARSQLEAEHSSDGSDGRDDQPGRPFPENKQGKSEERDRKVEWPMDGRGPQGLVKRGEEDADDARVRSGESGAHPGVGAEGAPEGQDGGDGEEAGSEQAEERQD